MTQTKTLISNFCGTSPSYKIAGEHLPALRAEKSAAEFIHAMGTEKDEMLGNLTLSFQQIFLRNERKLQAWVRCSDLLCNTRLCESGNGICVRETLWNEYSMLVEVSISLNCLKRWPFDQFHLIGERTTVWDSSDKLLSQCSCYYVRKRHKSRPELKKHQQTKLFWEKNSTRINIKFYVLSCSARYRLYVNR